MTNQNDDSIFDAKAQARRLRQSLEAQGRKILHAQALDLIAQQQGLKDWNALSARLKEGARAGLSTGSRISGRYLKQRFTGRVHTLTRLGEGARITIHFDAPVDVVQFESFSSLRQRVSAVVGKDGRSFRKTSDGVPHLVLDDWTGVAG